MPDRPPPARRFFAASLVLSASGLLAGCDDGSKLEAEESARSQPPRAAVSAEEQALRREIVSSASFYHPEYASQVRVYYDALDAGEHSAAVAAAGGIKHIRTELRAAEIFHRAHKLDGCLGKAFNPKNPGAQLQVLRRLASGRDGAALIADAKRIDPEGYAFDLSGYGDHPDQAQRVAAAYDTLSLKWKTQANTDDHVPAFALFARTYLRIAAVTDGKCRPDPKLQSLLEMSTP